MISIPEAFERCRVRGRKALIPYLTAGFPDEETFLSLVAEFASAGADLIEIGIPFSDPVADGKSIQYSSQQALRSGINVGKVLRMVRDLNQVNAIPLIIMTYYNPILSYGLAKFAGDAHAAGISGLIIPDMIPEEGKATEEICKANSIDLVYLLAPTSSADRRRTIISRSRGFVYLVSVTGGTGGRQRLPASVKTWVRKVKRESPLPVCVGFGISTPDQAKAVSSVADGVIVGSAIIDIIRNETDSGCIVERAGDFIRRLREGMGDGGS